MNGCKGCFNADGPIPVVAEQGSLGDCDFCGTRSTTVWDVELWTEAFLSVIEMYEQAPDGFPIERRLQEDWEIFTFDSHEQVRSFLDAVFANAGVPDLLGDDVLVAPRFTETGATADHPALWAEFRRELIEVNRFFPETPLDLDYLEDLVRANLRTISAGFTMHRGRVVDSPKPLSLADMGVPPPRKVPGGRGNPVGIPHLYLASDVKTCLMECRALVHAFVCVADFTFGQETEYLDLSTPAVQNPFVLATGEPTDLVEVYVARMFMRNLGAELSKPTRPGENHLEYVPTQYLCEFVKSMGIRGIRYASSLNDEGTNMVLFHPDDARTTSAPQVYEITSFDISFELAK